LPQQRLHAPAEIGHDRVRPLAPVQVAAEFVLQLADRARQRGLRDIALLGGTREVQRAGDRQEVTDLVHFHERRRTPCAAAWKSSAPKSAAGAGWAGEAGGQLPAVRRAGRTISGRLDSIQAFGNTAHAIRPAGFIRAEEVTRGQLVN